MLEYERSNSPVLWLAHTSMTKGGTVLLLGSIGALGPMCGHKKTASETSCEMERNQDRNVETVNIQANYSVTKFTCVPQPLVRFPSGLFVLCQICLNFQPYLKSG